MTTSKMQTIFDVGWPSEIGWSLYHRAHLQYLKESTGETPNVTVWTLPDRFKLYEGGLCKVTRTDLPSSLLSPFLMRNSFLYDGGPDIKRIVEELGIDPNSIIHGWHSYNWKNVNCYAEKMIFKPIPVREDELLQYRDFKKESITPNCKSILLLPNSVSLLTESGNLSSSIKYEWRSFWKSFSSLKYWVFCQ